jgi:hypothetical protein
VKNFARPRRISFVALGALATMLALSAPSQAADRGDHNFGGGHGGRAVAQHGREGGHFEGREEHHLEGYGRFGFGFGPIFPYYAPYYSAPSYPNYWYYCPSYNGYYPNITTCPEAWVAVPAQ